MESFDDNLQNDFEHSSQINSWEKKNPYDVSNKIFIQVDVLNDNIEVDQKYIYLVK